MKESTSVSLLTVARRVVIAGVTAALLSCSSDPAGSGNVGLQALSGANQTAEAGAALPSQIVVQVKDPLTGPAPGVRLSATVQSGASVQPAEAVTDNAGNASFTWTLANAMGDQVLVIENLTTREKLNVTATAIQAAVATVTVTPSPIDITRTQTQQFIATLRDARGAVVTGRAVTWTSSDNTTATVNASTGLATALALGSVDIFALSEGKANSARMNVLPTLPTRLALTTQPAGAMKDVAFATQPVVEIRDDQGEVVTGSSAAVTASIVSGQGTLIGTRVATAVNGVVRFVDLGIGDAGGAHTLSFASPSLASATSAAFTVSVVSVTTSTLPAGARGVAYSQTLSATGGQSYAWSLISGTLPLGLSLSTAGVVSGTPTTLGQSQFTVRATSGGSSGQAVLTITIEEAGVQITSPSQIFGTQAGVESSFQFTAAGGVGTYTWSIEPNSVLTPGLTLDPATGQLTGRPLSPGQSNFTVRVRSGPVTATQAVSQFVQASEPLIALLNATDSTLTSSTIQLSINPMGNTGVLYGYNWGLNGGCPSPGMIFTSTPLGSSGIDPVIVQAVATGTTAGFVAFKAGVMRPGGEKQITECRNYNMAIPTLTLTPANTATFTRSVGNTVTPTQTLSITSSPGVFLSFQLYSITYHQGSGWLNDNPQNGMPAATLALSADPTGLTPGTRTATINFSIRYSTERAPEPFAILVTFTVTP
jgi:hypothetical protein